MNEQNLQKTLEELGLSEKEASVYLAALQLGPTTVQQLAYHSGVKRTSVYHVVNSLQQQGLLREEMHGIKQKLAAARPEELLRLLERKKRLLEDALPYFTAMQQLGESESVIKHYEGLKQIQGVYLELTASLMPGDDYMVLSNIERWAPLFEDFAEEFLTQRAKLPIKVRMILAEGPIARKRKGPKRFGNEQTRILPRESKIRTTNLVITPRKVFVHQFEPPYLGLVIENQHMIEMHREMYEIMWSSLSDR